MTRRPVVWVVVALVVLIIELGATIGTVSGEPFARSTGGGRPARLMLSPLGCAALAVFDRFPLAVATIATATYAVFTLRDHDWGLFLPPMIAIFALTAPARHRLAAIVCALASLATALVWVGRRAAAITDPGVAVLAWVAFGTVLAVFFLAPLLIAEIVRTRSELREAPAPADATRA